MFKNIKVFLKIIEKVRYIKFWAFELSLYPLYDYAEETILFLSFFDKGGITLNHDVIDCLYESLDSLRRVIETTL